MVIEQWRDHRWKAVNTHFTEAKEQNSATLLSLEALFIYTINFSGVTSTVRDHL